MLSVINVLMQLRKVCNHPNLFEPRPTISPFQMEALNFIAPRIVFNMMEYDPFNVRVVFNLSYHMIHIALQILIFFLF